MKKQATDSIEGQGNLVNDLKKVFEIFEASDGLIRPHFVLTGPSGAGKTFTIELLCETLGMSMVTINGASITKEGVSGNSLSKALTPLLNHQNKPVVCFVDEFDKMFISGNSNDSSAMPSTTEVQNEFLKVLEAPTTQVFGDYGKYISANTERVLFVFAGAFNGEEDIDIDRLREMGIKTEFLGRVGLVYNAKPLSLEDMYNILDNSDLLDKYLELFTEVKRKDVVKVLRDYLKDMHGNNTLGARLINTLIHQYFIKGGLIEKEAKKVSFQKTLKL